MMIGTVILTALIIMYYGRKVSNDVGDSISFLQLFIISLLGPLLTIVELLSAITSLFHIKIFTQVVVTNIKEDDSQ